MPLKKSAGRSGSTRRPERSRRSPSEVSHARSWPPGSRGVSEGSSFRGRVVPPPGLRAGRRRGCGWRADQVPIWPGPRGMGQLSPQVPSPLASGGARRVEAQDGGPGFSATRHCHFSLPRERAEGPMGPGPPALGLPPPGSLGTTRERPHWPERRRKGVHSAAGRERHHGPR